jgi:hypothetical protein
VSSLARHYQTFEKLPLDLRGSGRSQNNSSLLDDERVKHRVRAWLTAQTVGSVTPYRLQQALKDVIFPDLDLIHLVPPTVGTCRKWLIKLGWRVTSVKKGVYKDGHEHSDVVEERNNSFLPFVLEQERKMIKYQGPDLTPVFPDLQPGEYFWSFKPIYNLTEL